MSRPIILFNVHLKKNEFTEMNLYYTIKKQTFKLQNNY